MQSRAESIFSRSRSSPIDFSMNYECPLRSSLSSSLCASLIGYAPPLHRSFGCRSGARSSANPFHGSVLVDGSNTHPTRHNRLLQHRIRWARSVREHSRRRISKWICLSLLHRSSNGVRSPHCCVIKRWISQPLYSEILSLRMPHSPKRATSKA